VWCGGKWKLRGEEKEQVDCGDDDEAKSETVLSVTEALHVFESLRVFMYAHNIVNVERSLFSLKRKGATKQIRINDFFKKK
jgi:hypothetical protein